jgi:hypothetical protein
MSNVPDYGGLNLDISSSNISNVNSNTAAVEKYIPPHLRNQQKVVSSQPQFTPSSTSSLPLQQKKQSQSVRDNHSVFFNQSGRNDNFYNSSSHPSYNRSSLKNSPFKVTPEDLEKEKELFKDTIKSGENFDKYDEIQVNVSGEDIVEPMTSFSEIDLGPALNRNISLANYIKPTPIQVSMLLYFKCGF